MAPLGASRKLTGNGGDSGRGSECARRPVAAHLGDRGPDRRGGRGGGAPLSRDFPPRPPRAARSAGPQRAGRGLSGLPAARLLSVPSLLSGGLRVYLNTSFPQPVLGCRALAARDRLRSPGLGRPSKQAVP